MTELRSIYNYSDDNGNVIECAQPLDKDVHIIFRGKNNRLVLKDGAKPSPITIMFDCDHGYCELGKTAYKGQIRVGHHCQVIIGDGVTCTFSCYISTAEYTSVIVGDDCMIASGNEIRTDDAHPIFSIKTGERINMPKSIRLGRHVWLGARAAVLGGSEIGDGSVIGYASIVKGVFPNNCVIAGTPAKVVRKDIAWERPHLNLTKPYFKPDASTITKSNFWNETIDPPLIDLSRGVKVESKPHSAPLLTRLFQRLQASLK